MNDTACELTVTRYIAAAPEVVWPILAHRQEECLYPAPGAYASSRRNHTAGEADAAAHREMGFEPGWSAVADQLATLCVKEAEC